MKGEATRTLEEDAVLVRRTIVGERGAFDTLTRRHLSRCYRFARRYGLSPEDATDVVQDTFLAAYRALDRFNFDFQFSTWITRILLNRLSNYRRGLNRAKRFFLRPTSGAPAEEFLGGADGLTPHTELERSELRSSLMRATARLPKPQRVVFILFEMEGLRLREIASLLEIPEGTVASRLHHARLFLRGQLREFL